MDELKEKGYTLCEYIESTGTQYIDTGYVATSEKYRIKMRFALTEIKTNRVLFGGGASTDIISVMSQNPAKIYAGSGEVSVSESFNYTLNSVHDMDCYANSGSFSVVFDGITYSGTYSGNINKEYTMALFGNNVSGSIGMYSCARVYSCQIYDNDILVRDYIPCQSKTDEYGLYDKVNGSFYPSAASTGFTGKWKDKKELAISMQELRRRLMFFVDSKEDVEQWYLTFKCVESGSFIVKEAFYGNEFNGDYTFVYPELLFKRNDDDWVTYSGYTSSEGYEHFYRFQMSAGDRIQFKSGFGTNWYEYLTVTAVPWCFCQTSTDSGTFTVSGTPLSMLYGDNKETDLSKFGAFDMLPKFSTYLETEYEHASFIGLLRIENPDTFLPSTVLNEGCYHSMFEYCSNLTNAPKLPATTLAASCYLGMFRYCTSLTKAPNLPASTLVTYCYAQMFDGCSNISYIKMLAVDIPVTDGMWNWVRGVSDNGTFVKSKDATWDVTGDSGIPEGWTVITE